MLYNITQVQDWINEKYRKQLGKNPMPPEEFMMQIEPTELAMESWFGDPIYDKYEDKAYIDFVQGGLSCNPEMALSFIIEVSAMEAIEEVDHGELETIGSEWKDHKDFIKDPEGFYGMSKKDFR